MLNLNVSKKFNFRSMHFMGGRTLQEVVRTISNMLLNYALSESCYVERAYENSISSDS